MMSPRKVLKLAKNQPGVAQNQFEFTIINQAKSSLFPKFFDKAPDDSWLELEMCRPATVSDFLQKTGIHIGTWMFMFEKVRAITPQVAKMKLVDLLESKTGKDFENLLKKELNYDILFKIFKNNKITSVYSIAYMNFILNPIAIEVSELVRSFNMPEVEVSRITTWGIAADNRLVFIDAGYNDNIAWNYYANDNEKTKEFEATELPNQKNIIKEFDYSYPESLSEVEKQKLPVEVDVLNKRKTIVPQNVSVPNMPEHKSRDPKNIIPGTELKI